MTPVISVKADLVTQNENYIYVPLASRTTYGSVKIGEGLNIEGGVLSFDKSEVSILTIAKNGEDIVPDENKRINITIDKTDVGLSDVDNTSDADKPVSTLQQIEFDKKINIYQGKEYVERALIVGEDGYVQPRAISITLDKDVVNKISVGGQNDAVNIGYTTINLKSLVEKSSSVGLPLATDTSAGLMSISDYKSIRDLQTRINRIENRVSKLLYDDNLYPTPEEIDAFVSSLGYTQPYDNIGVLVSGTHHIWHYYDNAGWIDDGIDIVDQFTNTAAGVIKGSSVIGKIYAETDGTGSVNGWDSLVLKLEGLENASDDYVKKQGYQEVTGPIVFVESVGIKNEDGTIDYVKHINNNLLITTSAGANLLNIDEGLSKVYFFNKEIAFKEDIAEGSGTTVKVGGVAVAEFDADTKADANTVEQLGTDVSLLDATVKGLRSDVSQQGTKITTVDTQLTNLAEQIVTNYYDKTTTDGKFATTEVIDEITESLTSIEESLTDTDEKITDMRDELSDKVSESDFENLRTNLGTFKEEVALDYYKKTDIDTKLTALFDRTTASSTGGTNTKCGFKIAGADGREMIVNIMTITSSSVHNFAIPFTTGYNYSNSLEYNGGNFRGERLYFSTHTLTGVAISSFSGPVHCIFVGY